MKDNINVNNITAILLPIFKKYHIHRAILFGSIAKGTAEFNSDLDIMV